MRIRLICAIAAGVAAGGPAVSAGSRSALLTVGVTVVRSCTVDTRAVIAGPPALRLSCSSGADSFVRVSPSARASSEATPSHGLQVVTLNF